MVDRINNFTATGDTEAVLLKDLNYYHRNPRRGDIDLVAASLKRNGQYKPITVNRGNHSEGGYKNEILAGNHTAQAAAHLKWTRILVMWVDVNDATAARIVAADNRTADAGTYDQDELLALLKDINKASGSYTGTGFTAMDVKALEKELDEIAKANDLSGLDDDMPVPPGPLDKDAAAAFDDVALGDEPDMRGGEFEDSDDADDEDEEEEEREAPDTPDIEDTPDELPGMRQLTDPGERMFDEGFGFLQFPKLRSDMFMRFEDIPAKLSTWAGGKFCATLPENHDPDHWWFYNYGSDSTSGMADLARCIVAFFAYDNEFDNWWWFPERYASKLLNSGIKYVLTPDWSMPHTASRVASLHQLYRSRYIGRYLQECGLKVCPTVEWPAGDVEFLKQYVLATLPVGLPLVALNMQNFNPDSEAEPAETMYECFQLVFDTLKPKGALIYGGKHAHDTMQVVKPNKGCKLHFQSTRYDMIARVEKGRPKRKKKATL